MEAITRITQRTVAEARLDSPWRSSIALLANIPTILKLGWHDPLVDFDLLRWIQFGLLGLYALSFIVDVRRAGSGRTAFLKVTRPEQVLILVGLAVGFVYWEAATLVCSGLAAVHLLRLYLRLVQRNIPPGVVFVGSFLGLVAIGTVGLKLPAATPQDQPISWLDAVFTTVSAISQTGLVVRPTGEGFTRFGQVIILAWIQVGALGVIVFGALLASVLGSSFGLRATRTIAEGTEQGWTGQLSLQRLVTFIILFTHLVELLGAVILYVGWPEGWDGMPDIVDSRDRFYHCVFFSVSAFCNAGFATTANSLEGLRTHWTSHTVIVPLIVLGSIGFPVLDNIRQVIVARIRGKRVTEGGSLIRFNLNTKIVLTTTFVIYIVGFVLIMVGELTQTTEPMGKVLLDAHFMNINRTSGFDTIPPQDMGLLSRLVLIFLMFVGGSPGSVAGGVKMMVFAVLVLTVWSTILGKSETTAFGRTISDTLVRKSATLIVLCLGVILTTTAVFVATESGAQDEAVLGPYLFEATSAFGTTGLSLGITGSLGVPGKVALIVTMFVGRVGILAIAAALLSVTSGHRSTAAYPTEDVVIY